MSVSKIFIPNFVRVLTNKRNYIERNFYSVAWVMLQWWDLGVLGGSKTLAWGFAMAPHRLRILVSIKISRKINMCTLSPHLNLSPAGKSDVKKKTSNNVVKN